MKYEDFKQIVKDDVVFENLQEGCEVLGWTERDRNFAKIYVIRCSVCAKDPEMYGDGLFTATKGRLVKGQKCCACAVSFKYSQNQHLILLNRHLSVAGYSIVSIGAWKCSKTRIEFSCENGHTKNRTLAQAKVVEPCKQCLEEGCTKHKQDEAEAKIMKIIEDKCLPYVFVGWDTSYKNVTSKFNLICSDHGLKTIRYACFLNGHFCNECSGRNCLSLYLLGVYDRDLLVGLKFGISQSPVRRVQQLNKRNLFKCKILQIWTFTSHDQAVRMETLLKNTLRTGIFTKREMKDGHTETTEVTNLETIMDLMTSSHGLVS